MKAYRSGAQTDLSEVIQIDNVFTNVTKGAVAPSADLQKAFGTTDIQTVLMEVLKKGELQVGEKERAAELEEMRREIATEVASRCVDPGTQRPHTVGMIEKSMSEIGYSVNLSKAAKVQVGSAVDNDAFGADFSRSNCRPSISLRSCRRIIHCPSPVLACAFASPCHQKRANG